MRSTSSVPSSDLRARDAQCIAILADAARLNVAREGDSPPHMFQRMLHLAALVDNSNVQKTSRLVSDNDTACENVFVVVVLLVAGVQLY